MMRRSLERKEVVREMVFTDEELQSLNAHIEDVPYADMILFACLIGLRPKEICGLNTGDVDCEKNCVVVGERVVPITPVVSEMLESICEKASTLVGDALFFEEVACGRFTINEFHYIKAFRKVMNKLAMSHSIHDTRLTFIDRARKANMDEAYLMKIIGA